jgi:hypothetical protein
MKNGLSFLPHFFLGVTGAHVFEYIHYMRFKTRVSLARSAICSRDKKVVTTIHPAARARVPSDSDVDVEAATPTDSFLSGAAVAAPLAGKEAPAFTASAELALTMCAWTGGASTRERIVRFCWRFFPDVLAIVVGITMSTLTPALDARDTRGPATFFMYCGLPLLFLTFGIVSMLQEGDDLKNASRYFTESIVMTS